MECTVKYLFSESPVTIGPVTGRKPFLKIRAGVLRACNLLLKTFEGDRKLLGIRIHFSKVEASDRGDNLLARNGLRGMLEGKDYRALNRVFPLVAAFIDRITKHEKALEILDKIVKAFKRILADTFDEHSSLGMYIVKVHLLDHMAEDLRNFGTLSVLNSNQYDDYNVHIKHSYKRTAQRIQT